MLRATLPAPPIIDLAALDRDHRRRRLRRNARDFAIDEVVEHQIADAEHGLLDAWHCESVSKSNI